MKVDGGYMNGELCRTILPESDGLKKSTNAIKILSQKQVCELISKGKYDDAYDLNFAMQRDEKIQIPLRVPTDATLH